MIAELENLNQRVVGYILTAAPKMPPREAQRLAKEILEDAQGVHMDMFAERE